jgi:hypothetical protein
MAKTHAAVAALFIVLAIAMTWPLTPNITRAVTDPGDPFINTWVLDWDWYAPFHGLPLFDANAFYPARDSLAYSENLYGIAIFLFPLRALGVSPLTAHNLAVLAGYAFSGFAAYLLGRFVSGSLLGGIAAGVFYAFVPFRFTQAGHVQHVVGGWLPLLLLALLQYSRAPTWGRAAWFGATFLFNGLTSVHALLFGSVAIAIAALILRPRWLPLIAVTAAAMLFFVWFLAPYREAMQLYAMQREWHETMSFSARPRDWLVTNFQNNPLYRVFRDPSVNPERWLFPGLLSIVIGAAGVAASRRKESAVAISWIILGFLGSLGLHTVFHRFLFLHVPGFRAIRVPARWAMIAYVGLAILVALGTELLSRRRKWIGAVIVAVFLVELRAAPIRWYVALPQSPPVYQWLAVAKPHALIELPIGEQGSDYGYLLRATAHHRPIVNGISGFAPPEFARLATLAQANPIADRFVDELRRIGVDTVVVHGDALGPQVRPWLKTELERGRLLFVRRFDAGVSGDWVFAMTPARAPALHRDDLEAFLRGEPTFSETTFGVLDSPPPEARLTKPWFEGFVFSPYGIREVNLLFNNGAIRERTSPLDDPSLQRAFRWYDATRHPRFGRAFDRRPRGVRQITDVQVEIIDGRGRRTLLEDRWIVWP